MPEKRIQLTPEQMSRLKQNVFGRSQAIFYDGAGRVGPPGTYYNAAGQSVTWAEASVPPPESTIENTQERAKVTQAQSAQAAERIQERKAAKAAEDAGLPAPAAVADTIGDAGQPTPEDAVKAAQEALSRGEQVQVNPETAAGVQAAEEEETEKKKEAAREAKAEAVTVDGILEEFNSPVVMKRKVEEVQAMLREQGVEFDESFPVTGTGSMRKNAEFIAQHVN